jgi:hypothetical protein
VFLGKPGDTGRLHRTPLTPCFCGTALLRTNVAFMAAVAPSEIWGGRHVIFVVLVPRCLLIVHKLRTLSLGQSGSGRKRMSLRSALSVDASAGVIA